MLEEMLEVEDNKRALFVSVFSAPFFIYNCDGKYLIL